MSKIFITFILLFSMSAFAAQDAVVTTDGSMVYRKADFDSTVIGYFRSGEKVRISDKTFGPFYRVIFKQGVIGYISDVDVQPLKGSKRSGAGKKSPPSVKKSFIAKTYLGPTIAMVNYGDVINKKDYYDSILMYGLKFNMPLSFLSGPFITDINLLYSSQVPNFYKKISSKQPNANFVFFDTNILFSFFETRKRDMGLYAGGGPLIAYTSVSNIDLPNNSTIDLTDVVFGGKLVGGAAMRIGSFAIKLEANYYILKSQFLGLSGSFQIEL